VVLNATFNNISVILWQSVSLVEKTGVPGENHWPVASYWEILLHYVVLSTPRHEGDSNSQLSRDRQWLHRIFIKNVYRNTFILLCKEDFLYCLYCLPFLLFFQSYILLSFMYNQIKNRCLLWKESLILNSDGHQFHQYQENEQWCQSSLIWIELTEYKKDCHM
jgi:hypothetical protein